MCSIDATKSHHTLPKSAMNVMAKPLKIVSIARLVLMITLMLSVHTVHAMRMCMNKPMTGQRNIHQHEKQIRLHHWPALARPAQSSCLGRYASTQVMGFRKKSKSCNPFKSILKFVMYTMPIIKIFNLSICRPDSVDSSFQGLSRLRSVRSAKIADHWTTARGPHRSRSQTGCSLANLRGPSSMRTPPNAATSTATYMLGSNFTCASRRVPGSLGDPSSGVARPSANWIGLTRTWLSRGTEIMRYMGPAAAS
mmetsp:Transcript_175/g.638  ORF Transcript_175/g.638 Transcript_175/m.638 type:complete len:252 (+) Transcript_175:878-1633(+)